MKQYGMSLIRALMLLLGLGVLAALLFPVFAPGRREPGRSPCQNNLKLIALSFKQYSQDWNELFPPVKIGAATSLLTTTPYGWADALQPYLKSTSIFQCPSEQKQGGNPTQPWEAGYTDYFLNPRVAQQNQTAFPNSANTVLLADGNDGKEQNDATYIHSSIPSAWGRVVDSPMRRHGGGCNYVFIDGHVKWLADFKHPRTDPTTGSNFTFNS